MLTKLELTNFCVFKGKHVLHFDKDKPITFIMSQNGVGKTTIINAFLWCLYGHVPYMDSSQLVNSETATETAQNQLVNVDVAVTLLVNQETIILERHCLFDRCETRLKKLNETLSINGMQSPIVFSAVVNKLFPEEYLQIFLWAEDINYRFNSRLKMVRIFSNEKIAKILSRANTIFSKLYFREGKYEIVYEHGIKLHRSDFPYHDDCLSEDDSIILHVSVLLAMIEIVKKQCPDIHFPIFIDGITNRIAIEHSGKLLAYLFSNVNMQIIVTHHVKDEGLFRKLASSSAKVGRRYLLEHDHDWTAARVIEICDR